MAAKRGPRRRGERIFAPVFVELGTVTQSFRDSLSMEAIRAREGPSAAGRTVDEHDRIFAALERRDGATARRELAEHLLRGTGLEQRESHLLELWHAEPRAGGRRGSPGRPPT